MLYIDNDGEFPTIAIGALIGGAVGGIGSIISDVAKGKKINWGKAGKNALKGAAAGAVIGTGVGGSWGIVNSRGFNCSSKYSCSSNSRSFIPSGSRHCK